MFYIYAKGGLVNRFEATVTTGLHTLVKELQLFNKPFSMGYVSKYVACVQLCSMCPNM